MHLETLKVFCDLAETKSFSKAAEVNGITQSAVSQQVRALETKYQVSLVERNRKACGLTPEGRTFLDAARRIVDVYRVIGEQLRSSSENITGQVRVASELSIGLHELPVRLNTFRESNPIVDITVQYLRTPEVYDAVAASEVDLGLVAYPQLRPGLKFEIFEEDELVVICHPDHHLAKKHAVELATLSEEQFIAYSPDEPTTRLVERELKKHRVELNQAIHFDNIETVKRAVEINSGVSLVPHNTVQAEVANGQLVEIPVKGVRIARPLGVIFKPARARSQAARIFIDSLRGSAAVPDALAVC